MAKKARAKKNATAKRRQVKLSTRKAERKSRKAKRGIYSDRPKTRAEKIDERTQHI
jgi:hypothetical protein